VPGPPRPPGEGGHTHPPHDSLLHQEQVTRPVASLLIGAVGGSGGRTLRGGGCDDVFASRCMASGVGAIAQYLRRTWLPHSLAAAPRSVFSGAAGSQHTRPRTGRTGPTATGASEVAMVGQASTWWFSADRRWHRGQPPPGWWQGPDRRWRPPTQAVVARPEPPAAPPTAAEPVEATAGDGPSDARPARGVRALHLKESPRRLWSRRHSP
jgi:hypothetical protein